MKNAINSHAGKPQSSTLRNPLLYTASASTTARKTQIMLLIGCHVAIGVARDLTIDRSHGWRWRQLISGSAHLHQDHLLLKRCERLLCSATGQQHSDQGERFHRIDSRPLGRQRSIAHPPGAVQNGVAL